MDGLGQCQHWGFGPSQPTRARGTDRDQVQETAAEKSVIPGSVVNLSRTRGGFEIAFCLGLQFPDLRR